MSSTSGYGTRIGIVAIGVIALLLTLFLALGSRALLQRETYAVASHVEATEPPTTLVAPQELEPADHGRLPADASAEAIVPAPATVPVAEKLAPAYLPPELQVLAQRVPEQLEKFEAASPRERLHLGRELLAYSIAVIQCAHGTGPIPRGMDGDGDLSFAGQDGKWSFQLNLRTFHFEEREFPEYAEYLALLNTVYDDQGHLLVTDTELPEQLTQDIRLRAQEALGWL